MSIDPDRLTPERALEVLVDELPWWTERFALPCHLFLAAVMGFAVTWVVLRLQPDTRRLHPDLPWIEKAQLAHPSIASVFRILIPVLGVSIALGYVAENRLVVTEPLFPFQWPLLFGVATLFGWSRACDDLGRKLRRSDQQLTGLWRLWVSFGFLFGPPFVVVAAGALLMDLESPVRSGIVWVISTGLAVFLLGGHGLFVAERLGVVRPACDRLTRIVRRVANDMGRSGVRCVQLPGGLANAFALPMLHRVVFLEALLELDDEQLEAVARHEIGHLNEAQLAVRKRILASLPLGGLIALPLGMESIGAFPSAGLLLITLVPLVYAQRSMAAHEALADQVAHGDQRQFASAYIHALEWMHSRNLIAVRPPRSRFASHPSLIDRMEAAGVSPDWEVPEPARKARFPFVLSSVLTMAFVGSTAMSVVVTNSTGWLTQVGVSTIRVRDMREWARSAATDEERVMYLAATAIVSEDEIDHYVVAIEFSELGWSREIGRRWIASGRACPLHPDEVHLVNIAYKRRELVEKWYRRACEALDVEPYK